jgi:hypothetical protein
MNAKQSLMAALVGFAAMIAMPIAASAGGYHPDRYQNTRWQAPSAVVAVGHYYGWQNSTSHNYNLICDEDGYDNYGAWPDENYDYGSSAGYDDHYYAPSYRDRAYNNYSYNSRNARPYNNYGYNSYDYNSGYRGAYNAPYGNNGANGGLSALMPLLQQFVR